MAGNLNDKHLDSNSRLTTTQGKLLCDYADVNSYRIFGRDSTTTSPYNPSATPDVLDTVLTKNVSFPVYLTLWSAINSDHIPVPVQNVSRSTFHHPPDRPDFRRTDSANFHTHLEELIPFDPKFQDEMVHRNVR